MPIMFLDEVDEICNSLRWWSSTRRAAVEFRAADFMPDAQKDHSPSLREAVERVVVESGRPAPAGPIALVANLRSLGWQFNPIALYFCYDAAGSTVDTVVAEVTNTPWKQRHCYVVDGPGEHCFNKQLHVSPFMAMDYAYHFSYTAPGEMLRVTMSNYQACTLTFEATLSLTRVPITPSTTRAYAMSAMAPRVSMAIYAQALRLKLKGAEVFTHPDRESKREDQDHAPI